MTRHLTPATATFIGAAGNKLVAEHVGDEFIAGGADEGRGGGREVPSHGGRECLSDWMAAWGEQNQTFIASMLHPYCMEKIARYEKALKHADFIVMDEIRPARGGGSFTVIASCAARPGVPARTAVEMMPAVASLRVTMKSTPLLRGGARPFNSCAILRGQRQESRGAPASRKSEACRHSWSAARRPARRRERRRERHPHLSLI